MSGPYLVSFDMGNSNHSTTTPASEERETTSGHPYTRYSVDIGGTNGKASILIDDDVGQMKNFSVEDEVKASLDTTLGGCGKPIIATRIIIDGNPGVVGFIMCPYGSLAVIRYPLDYSPENKTIKTRVGIISTYPWNEGTSILVKTIHVEKVDSSIR
jgi:hypothetical protein